MLTWLAVTIPGSLGFAAAEAIVTWHANHHRRWAWVRVRALEMGLILLALIASAALGRASLWVVTAVVVFLGSTRLRKALTELPIRASPKADIVAAFSVVFPLLVLAATAMVTYLPAITAIEKLSDIPVLFELGVSVFLALFGSWVQRAYSRAFTARSALTRRWQDVVFGALYASFTLFGLGGVLATCLVVDLVRGYDGAVTPPVPLLAMLGLLAVALAGRGAKALPVKSALVVLAGLVGAVGMALGSAPQLAAIAPALLAAAALADSFCSNTYSQQRLEPAPRSILWEWAPVFPLAVGVAWYVDRMLRAGAEGPYPLFWQALFLLVLMGLTAPLLAMSTSAVRQRDSIAWRTEDSGTFNVLHDSLLTSACFVVGVTAPLQRDLFESWGLTALISFLLLGAYFTAIAIFSFAFGNYGKHLKAPALEPSASSPPSDPPIMAKRLRARFIRQAVLLTLLIAYGWVFVIAQYLLG